MPAKLLAGLDAPASDARRNAPSAARLAAVVKVIPLVGVQLGRALARATLQPLDGPHGVQERLQHARVVPIGWTEQDRQRNAVAVHQQMPLGAGPTSVRWVWPGLLAPLFAGMLAESSAAR